MQNNTGQCHYNAVQYFMMLHTTLQMTVAECRSDLKLTADTSYLALTGKLWGVSFKDIGENWPPYNSTTLYIIVLDIMSFPAAVCCSDITNIKKLTVAKLRTPSDDRSGSKSAQVPELILTAMFLQYRISVWKLS